MQKLIIKQLNIINFRNLKNCSLVFNEQFNLIEGANSLGKSSILDAIRYIFFNKNSDNKRADNYKSVIDESLPHIIAKFTFNNKSHTLEVNNNKWFIDGAEFKKNEDYLKHLCNLVQLESIDELFIRTNPHLLVQTIAGKGEDKKTLKDEFVKIINLGLDKNNKLNDFENLVKQKNELNDQIKLKRAFIKSEQNSINVFKDAHSDIKNWNINDNINVHDLSSINLAIGEYEKIANEIKIKNDLMDRNQIKMKELQSYQNNNNSTTATINHDEKPSIIKLILLTIFTLGIYLFFHFKNKKQKMIHGDSSSQTNNQYQIKTLIQENEKLEEEIKVLKNNKNYKDIDYQALLNRQSELNAQNRNQSNINSYKITYQNKIQQIEKEIKILKDLEEKYILIDNHYKDSLRKIEEYVDTNFKDFKVSLFDAKGSDNFNITQNGVDLKNLNYANKNNIIHTINQFIKKGIEIDCFNLIDQVESFNKLSIENENTQTIACKVTNDQQLKLNGKTIN